MDRYPLVIAADRADDHVLIATVEITHQDGEIHRAGARVHHPAHGTAARVGGRRVHVGNDEVARAERLGAIDVTHRGVIQPWIPALIPHAAHSRGILDHRLQERLLILR